MVMVKIQENYLELPEIKLEYKHKILKLSKKLLTMVAIIIA